MSFFQRSAGDHRWSYGGRLADYRDLKLKPPGNHPESNQPGVSAITQLREKQVLPEITASTLSKKRKAVETTNVDLPSNKLKKTTNASAVQNDSQWQKLQRNRIQGENSEKTVAKYLQKQYAVVSCNSDRTKDLEQVVNCKFTKGILTPQGEHKTSPTGATSLRQILKPSGNTSKPVHDCSKNVSTNFYTPEVKATVAENCSSSCSKNTFTRGLNPVSFTVRSTASRDSKSKETNSSLNISSHLKIKSAPDLDTSNTKQSQRSHNLSCETFPHRHSLLSSSGSTNTKDSCYHQGNHLNKINMGLTPQTADSSLLRPPDHDGWLQRPGSANWKAANNLLDSGVGSFTPASSFNNSNDAAGWSMSECGIEEEQDIEDMEVDEGLAILSNLQEVRAQTSTVLQEPKGVLTETFTQSTCLNHSNAVDSMKDMTKKVILVVDTNVFISCLGFLQDIMKCSIPGYQGVVLVMPWVVMQELDYLKTKKNSINNLSISTSCRASNAIRFIYSHIIEKNSQLIGQTPQEAVKKADIPIQNNDDRILQCCLQFQEKYPNNLLILLTRDVNLINKAVITGIQASNNETLSSRLSIPKLHSGNRPTSCQAADTSNTKKRPWQNLNVGSSTDNDKANTALKTNKPSGCNMPSSTSQKPVPKKANLGLAHNPLPTGTPVASKLSLEPIRFSQMCLKPSTLPQVSLKPSMLPQVSLEPSSLSQVSLNPSMLPQVSLEPSRLPKVGLKPCSLSQVSLNPSMLPQVSLEPSKLPQGGLKPCRSPQKEADKAVVMGKFQAVWKLIHDMNSQSAVILAAGKSHANYDEAVTLLKGLAPLLSALYNDFSRCLYLSPVILWEHEADFLTLCAHLNSFYAVAQTVCLDPSQSVEVVQLMTHFHDTSNRSVLFAGLEQLSAFVKDVEAKLQVIS
ncbi:hypothetical protein BsWGS_23188 [Bradybaena similaris]